MSMGSRWCGDPLIALNNSILFLFTFAHLLFLYLFFCYLFDRLQEGPGTSNAYQLINPKKKAKKSSYKDSGKLILNSITTHVEPTFLDYIRGGTQIHFTVAVDFTASNGDPRTQGSLHYRQAGVDNQYSLAIKSVGEIIQDYDSGILVDLLSFIMI